MISEETLQYIAIRIYIIPTNQKGGPYKIGGPYKNGDVVF